MKKILGTFLVVFGVVIVAFSFKSAKTIDQMQFAKIKKEKKVLHRSINTDYITIQIFEEDAFIVQLAFITDEQSVPQDEPSFEMTIETQNTSNKPVAVDADTTIDLSSSSVSGTFSLNDLTWEPVTEVTIPAGESSVSFYYKDSTVGSYVLTASENPSQKWEDATQDVDILFSVTSFSVEVASPQIVDDEFSLTVTALDSEGNVQESFSGGVDISVNYVSPSSGSGVITETAIASLQNGVGTISNQTFSDCGIASFTAVYKDDASRKGTSDNITFVPDDFVVTVDELDFAGVGGLGLRHIVNKEFPINIEARTKSGETCTNYFGPATMEVNYIEPNTDQMGKVTPKNLTEDIWTNGTLFLSNGNYDKWGSVSFTVSDDVLTSQTGTSEIVTFLPKTFEISLEPPMPSRDFYYVNEPFDMTIAAVDEFDVPIINYQGEITLSFEDFDLEEDYQFTDGQGGVQLFEDVTATKPMDDGVITINDSKYKEIVAKTATIKAKEATLKVFSNQGPVGDMSIMVAVVDEQGNIIEEDNATMFTVQLEEAINDNSAKTIATSEPIKIQEGKAIIIINDPQAEVVQIVPRSIPMLKTISGQATFGTVARKGLGVQIFREIK